jgi:uncharacterized RDD family membrane protein YckC
MNPRGRSDPGAAFNERAAAFVLDWLILGGAAFLAAGGGGAGLGALAAVSLLNQGVATGLTGYSLGKAITGVRVARVDTTEAPGIGPGVLRWLLLWVDVQVVGLVGLVVAGRSPRRQRVGDLVARTWVVGGAPAPRARAIAAVAFLALCLAFVFVRSSVAGFALIGVFGPVAVGATVIVAGIARRRAPWPWLVGLGIALIPASYMASVKLCDDIAGTCISGAELDASQQAIISVVAFAAAAALLLLRRSRARDVAFQVLVLFGQAWLLLKLTDSRETPEAILVGALIAIELGYEVVARMRAARERAAEPPAVAA